MCKEDWKYLARGISATNWQVFLILLSFCSLVGIKSHHFKSIFICSVYSEVKLHLMCKQTVTSFVCKKYLSLTQSITSGQLFRLDR